MIVTEKKAIEILEQSKGYVMRFGTDGERLANATTWDPDDTWSTCLDESGRYYVIYIGESRYAHTLV